MKLVLANQATATKRRAYFDLRTTASSGLDPATGEAGGQPQISTNGGGWTNTGIGTLTHIGFGRYYADLTQAAVASAGDSIETRYDSAVTVETPGDTFRVVAFDPDDAAALGLSRVDVATSSRANGADYTALRAAKLDNLDAAVTTRSSHSAADVWAVGTRTLTSFGTLATDTATAVWTAGSRTLTSFGTLVADVVTGVWSAGARTLTSFSTLVADVWAHASRTLTAFAFNVTVGANLDKVNYALSTAGIDAVVNGILDEDLTGHNGANTVGLALSSMLATADPWAVAVPGAYGAGTAGNILGNRLDVAVSTRSTLTAAQVDTQLSGTHGAGLWTDTGGIGTGSNTVTITVQDNTTAPIPGRMVTIKNATETAVIAGPLPTDSLGQVFFNLDAGSYKALVASSATYLPLPAQTLVVTGTTAATYTLTPVSTGTPSAPSLSVISGFLTLLTGAPAAEVEITFQTELRRGAEDGDLLLTVGQPVTVTTDSQGFFSVELVRTDAMVLHDPDDEAVYNIRVPDCNIDEHFVLEGPAFNLADLLPGLQI